MNVSVVFKVNVYLEGAHCYGIHFAVGPGPALGESAREQFEMRAPIFLTRGMDGLHGRDFPFDFSLGKRLDEIRVWLLTTFTASSPQTKRVVIDACIGGRDGVVVASGDRLDDDSLDPRRE
ncbi:MAG: hypothetical protein ACLQAT_02255 [Candidatus Binataceae bacterium]